MTVHVLMPVFNRLALTQSMLECLRAQRTDEPLSIVVVNDGSTDGTAEFLSAQRDITILQGDGSLWWGGAIDLGLRHVFNSCSEQDWVLLVNNDIRIDSCFVQMLLNTARNHAPAAVGSPIIDEKQPHRLLSIGPRINPWRFQIRDIVDDLSHDALTDVISVDALSGRGVLYPISALRHAGGMRPRCLPHYLADYDLSVRVHSAGWRLLVQTTASVYSADQYGNAYRASSLWGRLLSVRSPSFLPARIAFWWSASSLFQRITMPIRVLAHIAINLSRRVG